MPVAVAAAVIGGVAAGAVGITSAISSAKQAKAAESAMSASQNVTPNASQTVGDGATNPEQLGRAALIATSPSGVLGTDPTGRRQLLGND